jgi:predicted dehydrogenase/threonine dehydrogenase-like Zn-dependent dehydrogenase
MKQIIQDLNKGNTILEEVPAPKVKPGSVLIKTSHSLVSLGTERMLVEFGKANYLDKAKQQPDKVKMVLDKVKTDGLKPTYDSVVNKLNQPLPLGYCNVGKVIEIGEGVSEFKVGDIVASNGPHAELVCVPKNLVAKVPDNVVGEEAAFTVIGSIALQGIRLCNPTIGETIVVMGLGLIGLITAELLKANGCNVIGYDFDVQKINLAKAKGIDAVNISSGSDPVNYAMSKTNQIGVDGVIITASSKSNDIIHQAAEMSRKRGRIILVGVIGLDIRRDDFFKKELTFQVSASYGPGRYDDNYEQLGQDYPIGFVRWTEKRNFETILEALSKGSLNVKPLITERLKLKDYLEVYSDMNKKGSIASIIEYESEVEVKETVTIDSNSFKGNKAVIGIVGAGNFTSSTLLPNLSKTDASLKYIADLDGLVAKNMASRHKIANATSEVSNLLNDEAVDTLMIITRHDAHADLVTKALKAKKNAFVEKPLALNIKELNSIIEEYRESSKIGIKPTLTVGFNRRFAPLAQKMKSLLGSNNASMNIIATMNAGYIPPEVWVHDLNIGGGRIIGEACHFIDLCTYLSGSNVVSVCMNSMGVNPEENTDNASILLKYENGTNAIINYFANGSKSYAKERLEVFSQNRVLIMDNWRKLKGYGFKGFKSKTTSQDKGHSNQFKLFVDRIKNGGEPLIEFDEIINTTKASFAAIQSLKEGRWINVE